jgi:hypothetical protein
MRLTLTACALAAVALVACSKRDTEPTPAGSQVAGAMPDTSAPRTPNRTMTAPDAGATGAAEPVDANGMGNAAGATVPNPEASPPAGNSR